jgi:hypothetical protein
MLHYSTPEDVIRFTGSRPQDFGFTTPAQLEDLVRAWLVEAKDLIDQDRNRDYHQEVVQGVRALIPPGIHNIAKRIVANMLALAVLRRETPVVKIDDFTIRMVEDQIFTRAIKQDLAKYPRKPGFRMSVVIPQ